MKPGWKSTEFLVLAFILMSYTAGMFVGKEIYPAEFVLGLAGIYNGGRAWDKARNGGTDGT